MPSPKEHPHRSAPSRLLAALVLLVIGFAATSPAAAHSGVQSYLYVSIFGNDVEGRVEIPIADLSRILEIEIPDEEGGYQAAMTEHSTLVRNYLEEHVALGDGENEWDLIYDDKAGFLPLERGSYALFPFVINEQFESEPRSFVVQFDVIYEADPNRDNLVIIENDWLTGRFANEGNEILGLSTGMPDQRVDLESGSSLSTLNTIRGIGTSVFRLQAEQVLSIVALLLPIGLLSASAANRTTAPSLGEFLRRSKNALVVFLVSQGIVIWVVVAASIDSGRRMTTTFTLAGLFLASMVALAVWWRPALGRLVPLAAAITGVASGYFVGTDAIRMGLGRSRLVPSVLAYQAGSILVVLITAVGVGAIVLQLRRSNTAPLIAIGASLLFAALSIIWMTERLAPDSFEIELISNDLETPWIQLSILVVLFIVALALGNQAQRADTGRPIHPESGS